MSRFAPDPPPDATWMSMPSALLAVEQMKPSLAEAPLVEPTARMGVWTQAYGDYERLTGQSPGLGEFSVLALGVKSTTWTGGVLGGVDFTFRGVASGGDGLIVGVLAGYESSHLSLGTASISSDPNSPSGFSTMKAMLSGPATGMYASYFDGGFSTDLAFKVDFYNLNLSFGDLLGFQSAVGFPPTTVPFSGNGTTRVNNYTTSGNVNYRFFVSGNVWTEPTAGIEYTRSDYASNADQFGLADGSVLRLQAGERFGVESTWDAVQMRTVFTGLLYDTQSYIAEHWRWWWTDRPFVAANIWPYVLKPAAEQTLKPEDMFRECSAEQGKDYCPQMVVLPAGSFIMGSPATEQGHQPSEEPQHLVRIAKPFAVSKSELTFDEWDTCVNYDSCPQSVADSGWGHGQQPLINVTWGDAQHYVAWLSKMTGKPYRLLTEAEYEFAARAGAITAYSWGDDIGKDNANCKGCGSQWDNTQTAPIGSFAANGFGLFDMVGNVWEWVEDCVNNNYDGAPTDGSAWIEGGDCKNRIVRGGSWNNTPVNLRAANRVGTSTGFRDNILGFRVARTLIVP